MKVYNKKGLILGVVWLIMGLWLLFIRVLEPENFLPEQIKDVIIALLLIIFGIGSITRAFSERLTQEEKTADQDERNQMIELKTKRKSFQLTQGICFCLMLAFFVFGKVSGESILFCVGLGLGFAYAISMFTELFTYFYYERKM